MCVSARQRFGSHLGILPDSGGTSRLLVHCATLTLALFSLGTRTLALSEESVSAETSDSVSRGGENGSVASNSGPAAPGASAEAAVLVDWTLSGFDRPDAALGEFRGRIVLLHFWATWCTPCRREIPALVTFHQGPFERLQRGGMILLSVSNDVRPRDLRRFLSEHPLPFPVFFDSLSQLNERLSLGAIPGTVVLDRHGRIVDRILGEQDWTDPGLIKRLEEYLEP